MYGPYSASYIKQQKVISYGGNNIYDKIINVKKEVFDEKILNARLNKFAEDEAYKHLHKIDNAIFFATIGFFKKIHADWCNLPLTTLMISSPGEVYSGKTLDYTTDTLPVDITWFDNSRKIFLAESSQFYLELRLLIDKVDKVFSIYNSFRKERADFCHLTEFQHIEFEGKVDFVQNINIFIDLLKYIAKFLVDKCRNNLKYFLTDEEINGLTSCFNKQNIEEITFREALDALYKETGDVKYKEFTMKYFHAWEEIKLTEIFGKHILIKYFPMRQIPFYHNLIHKNEDGVPLAESADLILFGYREVVGSGTRITDPDTLLLKARQFNLPEDDYHPYLESRNFSHYSKTSGFGLGWQRLVHWLLKFPVIWEATHIPRGHLLPKP